MSAHLRHSSTRFEPVRRREAELAAPLWSATDALARGALML
ncbi:hypothetical protein A6P39_007620 [Streptomyces sp. FXJ1.172]|nr:hypothetical protein [Streptomyces sp. FXJ1.172]WEO93888.1 hypothetical protein A6P39_007620 [Streptomyces sp. FXJ1.172]